MNCMSGVSEHMLWHLCAGVFCWLRQHGGCGRVRTVWFADIILETSIPGTVCLLSLPQTCILHITCRVLRWRMWNTLKSHEVWKHSSLWYVTMCKVMDNMLTDVGELIEL